MKAQTNRNKDFISRLLQDGNDYQEKHNITESFFAENQFTKDDLVEIFKEENFPEDKSMVFRLVRDFLMAKEYDIQIQDLFELIKISKIKNIDICRICSQFLAYRKTPATKDVTQLVELIDFQSWQGGKKEFLINLFSQAAPNKVNNFKNVFDQFDFKGEYDESFDGSYNEDEYKTLFAYIILSGLDYQISVDDFIYLWKAAKFHNSDSGDLENLKKFLIKNQISVTDVVRIFRNIYASKNRYEDESKFAVIKYFLLSVRNITIEELVDIVKIANFFTEEYLIFLIKDFLSKDDSSSLEANIKIIVDLAKSIPIHSPYVVAKLIYDEVVEKKQVLGLQDLVLVFELVPPEGDLRFCLMSLYLEKSDQVIAKDVIAILRVVNSQDNSNHFSAILKLWRNKFVIDAEQFIEILEAIDVLLIDKEEYLRNHHKYDFIKEYLLKPSTSFEDFINILISANLNDYNLNELLASRFSQNNISARDFALCINQADFKNHTLLKGKLAAVFVRTAKIDLVEDLIKTIKLVGLDYFYDHRVEIYKNFIGKQTDQTLTYQAIKKIIISDDHLKYDARKIVDLYRCVHLDFRQNIAQEFSAALFEIYPNIDFIRTDLCKEAIDGGIITKENINRLNLNQIEDDDLVLNFIEYATTKLELDPPHILALIKDRCFARYDFIKEVVGAQRLANQCLNAQGIDFITGIFGEEICSSLKILEVISYFDVHKQLNQIANFFTAEFRQEITNNFKPSNKNLVVAKQEIQKLQQLTATQNIDQEFLSVGHLCDYFVHKVATGPLTNPENFQINFEGCAIFTTEKQAKINQNFRNLLTNRDITNVDVIRFFQDVIGDDQILIDDDGKVLISIKDQERMFDLFQKSKSKFAHLFQQNGGITKFAECCGALLFGLSDGCVNNIGSQFSVAFYRALLKNRSDAALFQVMQEDIIVPILNRGGDVIGVQSDPLANDQIKQNYLSPPALFKKIAITCFYDEDAEKKVVGEGAWEFIWQELPKYLKERKLDMEEFKEEILNKVTEEYPYVIDQKAAQLATYILVCNTIGVDNVLAKSTSGLQAKEILDAVINKLAPIQEAESDQEIRSQGTLEEDIPDEELRPESVSRVRGRRAIGCDIM
ncbi:MAG: hypothetical protein V4612_05110 [Pseudomonadota bacterium]